MTKKRAPGLPAPLITRRHRVRAAMAENQLDAILLTSSADLGYLTGISWEDCTGVLTHDTFTLVTDSRYDEEVAIKCPWLHRRIFSGKQTMADLVVDTLFKSKAGRVGFEKNFVTHGMVLALSKAVKDKKTKGPRPRLRPQAGLMTNVRKLKDAIEIATIRAAVDVAQQAYKVVRKQLRVGMTENEIAARMEFEMKQRGASKGSFDTNVSAGSNSSLPHYRPAEVRLANNSALLFDWGALVGGYCSDITRTHAVGRPPAKLREIYSIVLEAQAAAIAAIRPGVSTRKVDAAARDIIAKAGYGKHFGHGLGHGIGLAIHELPRLSKIAAPEALVPGMVVTVEPGIYLPGRFGVRIEDDVLVTETGCEVLTSLDKSFEGCHIE
ncbi:MAG TPA: Xaa-Pro peptidase family protein [Tepidisphaeraceae bacterium]|mgnify:CR=1 FL=1|nr:Xaa-Pro peptidase family protein [Tepidisphaeraceae bacterium]